MLDTLTDLLCATAVAMGPVILCCLMAGGAGLATVVMGRMNGCDAP